MKFVITNNKGEYLCTDDKWYPRQAIGLRRDPHVIKTFEEYASAEIERQFRTGHEIKEIDV